MLVRATHHHKLGKYFRTEATVVCKGELLPFRGVRLDSVALAMPCLQATRTHTERTEPLTHTPQLTHTHNNNITCTRTHILYVPTSSWHHTNTHSYPYRFSRSFLKFSAPFIPEMRKLTLHAAYLKSTAVTPCSDTHTPHHDIKKFKRLFFCGELTQYTSISARLIKVSSLGSQLLRVAWKFWPRSSKEPG